jgi:hypothetical protein
MMDSMRMLDDLRGREFVPQDDGVTFDLRFGATCEDRMVRVTFDDNEVTVRFMTGNEVELWSARFTDAPFGLFQRALDKAVADAAFRPKTRREPGEETPP